MIASMKKTVRTAGYRGLFDGISGTWLRQMTYSVCRFWAYDEAKKFLGAGPQSPAWKLALAGTMGTSLHYSTTYSPSPGRQRVALRVLLGIPEVRPFLLHVRQMDAHTTPRRGRNHHGSHAG